MALLLPKLIIILTAIDTYLQKCLQVSPPALSSYLKTAVDNYNQAQAANEFLSNSGTTYNGFLLEVVEEPYSPTVNRRKAVAKNGQGIILLQTPWTFSTDNAILIAEIKLIIDSNDLKTY